jgi:hypothetical protein
MDRTLCSWDALVEREAAAESVAEHHFEAGFSGWCVLRQGANPMRMQRLYLTDVLCW